MCVCERERERERERAGTHLEGQAHVGGEEEDEEVRKDAERGQARARLLQPRHWVRLCVRMLGKFVRNCSEKSVCQGRVVDAVIVGETW